MDNFQSAAQFKAYIEKLKRNQFFKWFFLQPLVVELDANESRTQEIDIKAGEHFEAGVLTGNFTTLIDDGQGAALDDGTNHITAQFRDGSNNLLLSSNPVPLDLLLTPGRVLASGVAGDPSNQLFFPIKWPHIYGAKGSIVVSLSNGSDWTNTVRLLWIGFNLLAQEKEPEDF